MLEKTESKTLFGPFFALIHALQLKVAGYVGYIVALSMYLVRGVH